VGGAARKELDLEMSFKKGALRRNEVARRKSRVVVRPSMNVTRSAAGGPGLKKLSMVN